MTGGAWTVAGSGISVPAEELVASLTGAAVAVPELEGWRDWQVRLPGATTWLPLAKVA